MEKRKQIANRHLVPYFGKKDTREIKTLGHFQASLKERGLSGETIYNVMGEFKAFLRFNRKVIKDFPRIKTQAPAETILNVDDHE
jgi:hypothetical protein